MFELTGLLAHWFIRVAGKQPAIWVDKRDLLQEGARVAGGSSGLGNQWTYYEFSAEQFLKKLVYRFAVK